MRYPFKKRNNPRLLFAYAVSALLLAAAIIPLSIMPGIVTVAVSLICGYLAYQIIKFLRNHLQSYILTHDDGITMRFPDTTVERLGWNEITHTGIIRTPVGKKVRFIYAEEIDRLATVPAEYERLEKLDDELQAKCAWYELEQQPGESLGAAVLPVTAHAAEVDDSGSESRNN